MKKDQITRSSLSIGSNIAELITQIYIGIEMDCIPKQTGLNRVKEANELLKMPKGLQAYIKARQP